MVDSLTMFDEENNPHYNFKHLLLKISFSLIDIQKPMPDSIIKYSEFIHEYTHYLQYFTTINGICAMLSYFEAIETLLAKIPSKVITRNMNLYRLVQEGKGAFLASRNRLYWEHDPIISQNNSKKVDYKIKEIFNPVFGCDMKEIFIFNINDQKYYHISTRVLRENMAQMATFYVRGIGEDAIMDYVNTNSLGFQYWIIFSYFLYNYPSIENKIFFTYFFCEFVLLFQETGELMYKLFPEINNKLADKNNFHRNSFQIFDELMMSHRQEIDSSISNIESFLKLVKNKYNIKSRYGQFYLILGKLLNILENGLEYRKNNCTIFNSTTILTGEWVNIMCKIALSPVIKQKDGEFRVLFDDQDYVNELFVFFAVSILIEKHLNNKNIISCPFCKEIPICDEYKTRNIEELCLSNPFEIKKFNEGGCAFYNASLVLGILPNEELEKYLKKT
jgi:hypothetical protein